MTRRPLVDVAAGRLCLGDGWHAVETVDTDGERSYWLLDPDGTSGRLLFTPPHEQVGPLPRGFVARLATPVQPRCGRPRLDGGACRTMVGYRGAACGHHRKRVAS